MTPPRVSPERSSRPLARFARDLALAAGVFAVVLAGQLPYLDRWFNFMDEGHMLQFADLIADGGELYRDATVYPLPGAFYFLAGMFRLFEPSILLSRWIVVVQFALFAVVVCFLVRRAASLPVALGSVVVLLGYRIWSWPHWHIYSYSTTSLLVLAAALWILVRWLDTHDRRWLAAAGLAFGLGVFCKQDYGAAALLTMSIGIAVDWRSRDPAERGSFATTYAWFIAPGIAVGLATLLHFARQGMLDEFLQLTVFNHFVGMGVYEYMSFPDLLPLLSQDPELRTEVGVTGYMPAVLFHTAWEAIRTSSIYRETAVYDAAMKAYYYAPLLWMAGGSLRLWWRRAALGRPEERVAYLTELLVFVFGFWLMVLVRINKPQDYLHLAVLYWPILVTVWLWVATALSRSRFRWPLGVALALPALVVAVQTAGMAWQLRVMHPVPVPGERSGVYATEAEAEMASEIVEYITSHSSPDEEVAVMPYFPILQFLADRRGPHRSAYILWPFPEFPDRDERIIRALEEKQTRLLIYNFTHFHSFPPVHEYAPELFAYLVDHYEIDHVFTYDHWGYKLAAASRRDAPRPGTPLLARGVAEGSLRIESLDVPPRDVPPHERGDYLRMDLWPFRPTLMLRPTHRGRTVLSVPIVPAADERLQTAVSVNPQQWFKLPKSWVRFRLDVVAGGVRTTLFEHELNPTLAFGDRRWFEVDAPLGAWAGREVALELSTEAERPEAQLLLRGGWERPRRVRAGAAADLPEPEVALER